MAIQEINSDIDVLGRIHASTIPNSTGSIVTWNATTRGLGLRTNAQIISDLGLNTVISNSHTHTNKTVLDGITSTNVNNWNTAFGWGDHAGLYSSRASVGGSANSVLASDTRNTNPIPSTDLKRGVWFDFKSMSTIGTGTGSSSYGASMTFVPYGDDSGNDHSAFRLTQSSASSAVIPQLFVQKYRNGAWYDQYRIWHEGNFDPAQYVLQSSLNTQLSNYLPLSGGTMTGSIIYSYSSTIPIVRNMTGSSGGYNRGIVNFQGSDGVIGGLYAFGNGDTISGLSYIHLGIGNNGSHTNTLYKFGTNGLAIGLSGTTSPTNALYVNGSVRFASLNSAGFVKTSANGTLSVDTNDYALASSIPNITGLVPYTGATQDVQLDDKSLSTRRIVNNNINGGSSKSLKLYASLGNNRYLIFKLTQKIYSVNVRMNINILVQENTSNLKPGEINIGLRLGNTIQAMVSDNLFNEIVYYEDEDTGYIAVNLRNSYGYADILITNDLYFSEVLMDNSLDLTDKTNVVNANIHVIATEGWVTSQIPTVNNGQLTLSTGTGLSGSATFTANQSGGSTFSVAVASTHKLPTTAEWTAALANTITRLRGTTSGTYTSGDLTLLAGANTTITQSGANITIASTNTNTTYTSSNGILLTGTNFTPVYGTAANTIAQGNDSRINNGQTAFSWGNHSGLYALVGRSIVAGNGLSGGGTLAANRTITLGTPTAIGLSTTNAVQTSSHTHALDSATTTAINNGQTAFGWGNHALAGYALDSGVIHTNSTAETKLGKLTIDNDFEVTGISNQSGVYDTGTDSIRVLNPKGAIYQEKVSSFAGAIKIILPRLYSSTMQRFRVDVYNYQSNSSFSVMLGGYNYSTSSAWTQTFAQVLNGRNEDYTIRFGDDGVNSCVWIGELDSNWRYPIVSVTDFIGGFSNTNESWAENWDIAFVTAFDNVTTTHNNNYLYADWNKLKDKPTDLLHTADLNGYATESWVNSQGFSTQTLTAGTNINIVGNVISATDTNTTYSAGTGLSLTGTVFGQTITTSGTGTFVTGVTQTANGFQINLGTPPNTNTTYTAGTGLSLTGTTFANTSPNATHTGDVTGATALTIATSAVTLPKIQNIATQTFLGRATTGTGNVEALTVAQMQTLLGFSTQTLGNSTSNLIVSNTVQRAALTGDVTASQNSNATTIANNAVTTAKIINSAVTHAKYQNIATQRILGRGAAGAGNVQELTLGSNISITSSGVINVPSGIQTLHDVLSTGNTADDLSMILTFDGDKEVEISGGVMHSNDLNSGAYTAQMYDRFRIGFRRDYHDIIPEAFGGTRTHFLQNKDGTLAHLDDITSNLGNYVPIAGNMTISGTKTFTSIPVLPSSNPTSANHAVRKAYVDAQKTAVVQLSGNLTLHESYNGNILLYANGNLNIPVSLSLDFVSCVIFLTGTSLTIAPISGVSITSYLPGNAMALDTNNRRASLIRTATNQYLLI